MQLISATFVKYLTSQVALNSGLVIITRSCQVAYKHSTFIQRCRIHGLWRVGHNQTEIAKEIGVHKSTISREFKRNIFWWNSRIPQYKPHYAQSYTENRHKNKLKQQRCCRNGRSS
ncbi:TPA: hypothetical protein EYN98_10970 [Candidatus Poribacteria bacterium]|nr:hypothetical protein [Candidatus Poribacteria bacterium]HIO68071.1 hypothetical protein [Flavobacteriales bacterium]HIA66560.1 hypothetical protein [Candidatus Poribacteria bacterium]HIB85987.1 hypothetical protein [Candidatus Poribacteria bacterium]HIC16598.1 hypothetical protein [Candidatus Poribacteria bacterium]